MVALLFSLWLLDQSSSGYRISTIKFEGNRTFRAGRLNKILVSRKGDPFSEAILKYDLDLLVTFYNAQGFIGTRVTSVEEKDFTQRKIKINIKIDEGERPRIDRILLAGVEEDEKPFLMKKILLAEGDYLIDDRISRSNLAITNEFKERGFPEVKVTNKFVYDTRSLIFTVERGSMRYFRNTRVTGLRRYRESIIKREIKIKKGDIYSLSRVLRSQRAIYGLGLFGYVDASTEPVGSESVDVNFIVSEISPRIFNFGIGIQLPIRFLASFGHQHLNLFNAGNILGSDVSFAINLKKEYDVKFEPRYTVPHIFNTQFYFLVYPFLEYEHQDSFNRMTRGVEGKVFRFLGDNLQINLANRYKYVDLKMKATAPRTDRSAITNSIIASVIFDLRDDFFTPSKGIYIMPLFEDAGGILGGDNHFYRLNGELRYFLPLIYGVGALRIRAGRIYPRREPVSLHEKFSLGGQLSLRGFDEKAIGPDSLAGEHYGDIMANLNLEYRFDLYKSFGGLLFFDLGDVRNEIQDFGLTETPKSIGAGLRFKTPIGPIRFDYGRGFGQKRGHFYFGLYHIF